MKKKQKKGRLEVICGSMFSGKSEELIRRLRRAEFAQQTIHVFKHNLDNRKTTNHINAHSGDAIWATAVSSVEDIQTHIASDADVIAIDEVQFYAYDIVLLIDQLVASGKRVIVAGLDLDFRGVPFGCMPTLMALADEITKLKAVCTQSGSDAHHTQRIVNGRPARHNDPLIMIGAQECYEARSREHFKIDKKPLDEYIEKLKKLTS